MEDEPVGSPGFFAKEIVPVGMAIVQSVFRFNGSLAQLD
jgi:hypothetical protein